MKKLKKFWKENRVLMVLAIILVICLIVMLVVAITYFYGSSDNVYGNRLEVTEKVPLNTKLLDDISQAMQLKENVGEVSVTNKGKIVYINIKFSTATEMEKAKKIAEEAVTMFNEDELEVYDIQFTIASGGNESFKAYTLMGARNSSGSGIVIWNNYTEVVEESSAE